MSRAADADAIRAAFGPPDERDLADLLPHGAPLRRFVGDLGELLDQIAVAGLAHPDADWAPAAEGLIERARRLGLGAAGEALAGLADAVDAARAEAPPGVLASPALTTAAWHAAQRLVAWRRLFTRELAFQRVEGQLAADALTARGERPPRATLPTASARVRPLGLSLRDDRLTILGVDVDGGHTVRVRDRISDHDPDDLLGKPVISRLFQARIGLRAVLDGLIVFEDHPVGRARGGPLFAPAFRAVPRRLDGAFEAPLPALPRVNDLEDIRRPSRCRLRIERALAGVVLRAADGDAIDPDASDPDTIDPDAIDPHTLEGMPALALNLLGALLDGDGMPQPSAELDVVLGPGPGAPRILCAFDPLDGARIFPGHDPRALTMSPVALYRRACAVTGDPVGARFLRTVAGLFGGAADGARATAREQWRGPLPGIDRLFRAVLGGRLVGTLSDPARDDAVERAIDDALLLGALPADQIRHDALEALLGGPVARGAGVPGRAICRALWLLFTGDPAAVAARRGRMLTLYAARYAEPGDGDAHDIAARALLLAELSRQAAADEVADGEAPLTTDEILTPARQYLDAHLADLRPAPGRAPAPLPAFDGLWALGEAHRLLWPDASPRGLPALGLHRPTLAEAVMGALLDLERRPLRAADGLLCAAAAGIEDWLVGPWTGA